LSKFINKKTRKVSPDFIKPQSFMVGATNSFQTSTVTPKRDSNAPIKIRTGRGLSLTN